MEYVLFQEGITKDDIANIEGALDSLGSEKKRLYIEKEELKDLKAEMADYKEDIQDLHVLTKTGDTPVEVSSGSIRFCRRDVSTFAVPFFVLRFNCLLQVRESKAAKRLYKRDRKSVV